MQRNNESFNKRINFFSNPNSQNLTPARLPLDPILLQVEKQELVTKIFPNAKRSKYISKIISFKKLPDDIFSNICAFFTATELYYFSRTSRKNYHIATQNTLWIPHLLQRFPFQALTTLQYSKNVYSDFNMLSNQAYKLITDKSVRYAFQAVHEKKYKKIVDYIYRQAVFFVKDDMGIDLIHYIRDINNPKLNDDLFEKLLRKSSSELDKIRLAILLDQDSTKVKELLINIDTNHFVIDGLHILNFAISYQSINFVKLLLDRGVDVDVAYGDEPHPLYLAAQKNILEIVELLLECGAQVNQLTNSHTALYAASERGHVKIVKCLLEARADCNLGATYSPALVAMENGKTEVLRLLLQHGADITKCLYDYSLLMVGVMNNQLDCVKLLLNHYKENGIRSDINDQRNNQSALSIAVEDAHINMCQLLYMHGADLDFRTANGRTLFHIGCKSLKQNEMVPIIHWLIKERLSPAQVCMAGQYASHVATDIYLQNIMHTLEEIANVGMRSITYVEPIFIDVLLQLPDALNHFVERQHCFPDKFQVDENEIMQARILMKLLTNALTPFGYGVILFAFLNCETSTMSNTLFENNSNNMLLPYIIHFLNLLSKTVLKRDLHTMIWHSLDKSSDLMEKLQQHVISKFENLFKSLALPDSAISAPETIYLHLFESKIKQSYLSQHINDRSLLKSFRF